MKIDAGKEPREILRRKMRALREAMMPAEVERASAGIIARLQELEPFKQARCIMGFDSIHNEVKISSWLELLAAGGQTVLFPRMETGGMIEAISFTGWTETTVSPMGMREPAGEPFNPYLIDVVLVPGLVFDARGYRLGYGKGYYDRFIPRLRPGAFVCGLCFEFQVVDDVYPHKEDVPMHWVVTDKSEIAVNWDFF